MNVAYEMRDKQSKTGIAHKGGPCVSLVVLFVLHGKRINNGMKTELYSPDDELR